METDPTPSIPVPPKHPLLNRPALAAILVILFLASIGYLFYSFAGPGYNILQKPAGIPEKTKKPAEGLSFAPQLLSPSSKAKNASASANLKCPVNPALCQNPNAFKESTFSAQLAQNSPLFAAFDGSIANLSASHPIKSGEEKYSLVILTNNNLGLQAMYYLKGTVTDKTEVLAGERIATASGQNIRFMDNKSLVFSLIEATATERKLRTLSIKDFK